jgi:hypothetical protein
MARTAIFTRLEITSSELFVMKAAKKKIAQKAITIVVKSFVAGLLSILLKEFTGIYILFTRSLQLPLPSMRTFGYANQSYFFMKHLKKSFTLLMLLTLIIGYRASAQHFDLEAFLRPVTAEGKTHDRAKDVIQDNEYTYTGYEQGGFFTNPLLLTGKPLDYNDFNMASKGELSVIKVAAITGAAIQVPFYVYLRRNGNKVLIPGKERSEQQQIKIDLSEILKYAKPGDQLVIEAVRKEDGAVKRILKLLDGC